jgi:hypothetical protein
VRCDTSGIDCVQRTLWEDVRKPTSSTDSAEGEPGRYREDRQQENPNAHKPRKRNRTGLAYEVGAIAREVGAEVVEGDLRYPSVTGAWLLGDIDLGEHLDRYRDQHLMLVFVPLGEAERETFYCIEELAGHDISYRRDDGMDFYKRHGYREEIVWSPTLVFLAQ